MKEITKKYLEQCFNNAVNGLHLKAGQVEIITKLRELLFDSGSVAGVIERMKKNTELSTFAIKLNEAYNFIETNEIDFSSVSYHFNEHTENISKTLNKLIEQFDWQNFQRIVARLNELELATTENTGSETEMAEFMLDYEPTGNDDDETLEMKSDFILDDEVLERDLSFAEYKEKVLDSIKNLDALLNDLLDGKHSAEQIFKCLRTVEINKTLSEKHNFDIITRMHQTFEDSLRLIQRGVIKINKQLIYAMRSCLIVIAAIIKDKKVDITEFLKRAEFLGREIEKLKEGN